MKITRKEEILSWLEEINPLDASTFLDDDELFGQDKIYITCNK